MKTIAGISSRLFNRMAKDVEKLELELFWDYNQSLSEDQIKLIVEDKFYKVQDSIWEMNTDTIFDMENDAIKGVISEYQEQIEKEDPAFTDDDTSELVTQLRDYCPGVDVNMKQLISNTGNVNVRVQWYSNYDCINSHWLESQGEYMYKNPEGEYQEYFGQVVDLLNLNPHKVKEHFTAQGIEMRGEWPDLKERNEFELVSYEDFWVEEENRSCGACLFSFIGQVDLNELIEGKPTKVVIPKGNTCGFFSSMQGGGSMIDMELREDVAIDLTTHGDSEYDHWALLLDGSDGYAVSEVYGCTDGFFGNELTLIIEKDDE